MDITLPPNPIRPPGVRSDHGFCVVNRLEPRPRSADFDRALRAEVHDPLWMLTRQWLVGEFQGEDTGRAVTTRLRVRTHPVTHRQRGAADIESIDPGVPFEAQIEALPRQWDLSQQIRVGQAWRRRLESLILTVPARVHFNHYCNAFPLTPTGNGDPSGMPEYDDAMALATGRAMDGAAFVAALEHARAADLEGVSIHPDDDHALNKAGVAFLAWAHGLRYTPETSAWSSRQMEYDAGLAVRRAGESTRVLVAKNHRGGLDWSSFDVESSPTHPLAAATSSGAPPLTTVDERTSLTSKLSFPGMPASRWWELEDGHVSFGQLKGRADNNLDGSNLAQILFAEFALTYGNDWHLIPVTVPAGRWCEIDELVVVDVFGQKTRVDPATSSPGSSGWDRFGMFEHTIRDEGVATHAPASGLLVAPNAVTLQRGPALEEVLLVRDEMANLVWAIESKVADRLGGGTDGALAGKLRRALLDDGSSDDAAVEGGPEYRYHLRRAEQPEHWIPFVAEPIAGQEPQVQLRRARLRRMIDGRHEGDIAARTAILDAGSVGPFVIDEAQVSRAGVTIRRAWRRSRGVGGAVTVWLAHERTTGRGEGRAAIRYDQLTQLRTPESSS